MLVDSPRIYGGGAQYFETCAVCTSGLAAGYSFGCVHWGAVSQFGGVSFSGDMTMTPRGPTLTNLSIHLWVNVTYVGSANGVSGAVNSSHVVPLLNAKYATPASSWP